MENTLPWIEKYRPQTLNDILGHNEAVGTIRSLLVKGDLPHILLHGPPGTGKTSLVQAIAKTLYGPNIKHMVLEMNASDDRGISVVRTQIKTFVETRAPRFLSFTAPENVPPPHNGKLPAFFAPPPPPRPQQAVTPHVSPYHAKLSSLKLVILDEVDQMTAAAQTALRRIMEKHAEHCRFFLMCNDLNKINPPIQSRCTKFRFRPLKADAIMQRLEAVAEAEHVTLSTEAKELLVERANGDFRHLLNTLQATTETFPGAIIEPEHILRVLGLPSTNLVDGIIHTLLHGSFADGIKALKKCMEVDGYSMEDLLGEIYTRGLRLNWPNQAALTLWPRLADIETNLSLGADPDVQMAAMVGSFIEARTEGIPTS